MRAALVAALTAAGCIGSYGEPPVADVRTGGNAKRGERIIEARHCGSCHVIPGIRGAKGVVGPPLTQFALRSYIGGEVANTPRNLIRWVKDPHQIEPRTAMPAVGLDEQESRDVAAFLYTLR
jgi:cytochrome c